MSLDRCEEYIGPATPTGKRATCDRPSEYMATRDQTVLAVCKRHVRDYQESGLWRVVRIAGR